jgi:hypothetical protein
MKHHKGIREVVLLFLSMAALALAVSGRYDWRWGQPVFQHEDERALRVFVWVILVDFMVVSESRQG